VGMLIFLDEQADRRLTRNLPIVKRVEHKTLRMPASNNGV